MRRIHKIILASLAMICMSCSPKLYPTESSKDVVYVDRILVDSVFVKDSVFIKEKNDTITIYKEKIREKYKYIHDTTLVYKTDTLHTIERVEVEKPIPQYVTNQVIGFWILLSLIIAVLGFKVARFVKR